MKIKLLIFQEVVYLKRSWNICILITRFLQLEEINIKFIEYS